MTSSRVRPLLFAVSLLALGSCHAQAPAPGLAVSWDNQTGQPSGLTGHDARGEFTIAGADPQPLLELSLSDGGHTYTTSRGQLVGEVTQSTEQGNAVRRLTVVPCAADGQRAPLRIAQTYTVYPEGAVFCDFTISVPADAASVSVTRVELAVSFPSGDYRQFRWFWKRDWRGDLYLTREQALDTPGYLRVMGASFSRGAVGYTNHWEMFLEKKLPFGGATEQAMSCQVGAEQAGRKPFTWTLYAGAPLTLGPGFSYSNRWGMDLTGVRQQDNAIGQRIAHWQEGNAALMTFPSDSAIEAMADCGVTINILHLYWRAPSWGTFSAFDDQEMARWVSSCHRRGIKCVLYATPIDKPGLEGISVQSYGRYHCDGLYFDFGSVHFRGDNPGDSTYYAGRDFPAMDFLNLTRHYRQTVGRDGIMIAHAGGAAPDALYCLNLNAYLPGEADEQSGLLSPSLDAVYYHSGLAYAVCHPWCEYEPFQTRHAVANFCAIGAFPQVLFGRGTHQDNNYSRSLYAPARFALPYWQMLRCLPMDRGTTMYSELTPTAARANQPGLHCVTYRRSGQYLLVTVSNTGVPCSGAVTLDRTVLQPAGGLRVFRLSGPDIAKLKIEDLGRWDGRALRTGPLAKDDYLGFVLAGGRSLAEAQRRLGEVRRLVSRYQDQTPPTAVKGLQATPQLGVVNLQWQAATDNNHVVTHRLYRTVGGVKATIADAEEILRYSDYTAPPGAEVTYSVTALDVAGNEGPATLVAAKTPSADLIAEPLAEKTALEPTSGQWAFRDGWHEQSSPQGPATEAGATYKLNGVKARFLRVYFTGGSLNYDEAHLIELQARGTDGQPIKPRQALSSGDDVGHPVQDIMDGVTDKERNGWWSDRNKGLPAWAGLDFGEPVAIGEVWLLTFWDGQRYYQYSVEVSEDGQEWLPVAAVEGAKPLARSLASVDFADGTASVTTLETAPERSGGGLLFRCPDADNGYAFYLDNGWDGNACLARLEHGKLKPLASLFFPYSIFRPIPHLLQVRAEGDRLTCYADQVKVFEVRDKTFARGKLGVLSLTGGALRFRNLLGEGR
jgi:hypothetical protein